MMEFPKVRKRRDCFGMNDGPDFSSFILQLSQEVICLEALRQLACKGIPNGGERAIIWKLLLGYLPVERDSWEFELTRNRERYAKLKKELVLNPSEFLITTADGISSKNMQSKESCSMGLMSRNKVMSQDHPLSIGNGSIWECFFKNAETAEQIDRDLLRTQPDIEFFSMTSPFSQKIREEMRNILLLFAKLNPAIGYVQGMNEVLAPLYYVCKTDPNGQNALYAEADSFACFVGLLSGCVDHFCEQLDHSSVGIHATLSHLSKLLKVNDEELWQHLENSKVNPQFYAFRWITLLLTQEFELPSVLRIWDCLLSNPLGVQEMLLRICCAMLLSVKDQLLLGDFSTNLMLLQHFPEIDIEYLLNVAHQLTSSFISC